MKKPPKGAPPYWVVQDEEGLVHSVHAVRSSAWQTLRWLTDHHPRFYADWFVQQIQPNQLATIRWRKP